MAHEDKEMIGSEALTILPIVSLQNLVLFPHNLLPTTIGKDWPIELIEKSIQSNEPLTLGVITRKTQGQSNHLKSKDLFEIGTQAKIIKLINFPEGSHGVILQGLKRFRIVNLLKSNAPGMRAHIEYVQEKPETNTKEALAIKRSLKQLVQKAISLSPSIPAEVALFVESVQQASYLADLVVPYLSIDYLAKQEVLEMINTEERIQKVHALLVKEIEILELSKKVQSQVQAEVNKQQRRYFVREQLKLLQKELNELDGKEHGSGIEIEDLREKLLNKTHIPHHVRESAQHEINKMSMMQPSSPEYMVCHNYIQWLLDLPWGIFANKIPDLKIARSKLDQDHFGLEKVKKRILEYLAVLSLRGSTESLKNKGTILLFVGPPGVGKTSLGRSIAQVLERPFHRIALGGMRDEAELRGHRRTYIGSMPGKIVDALKKSKTMDPLILLDEVDKVGSDGRGDPAHALLEILDPEQNSSFTDHYLSVPIDLSKVLFIATANSVSLIPSPLLDRMEVIEINGYTLQEKVNIASKHLIDQVQKENGLSPYLDLKFSDDALSNIIQQYTREAGVRQLKRELDNIGRHLAFKILNSKNNAKPQKASKTKSLIKETISTKSLQSYLGKAKFLELKRPATLPIGIATGLAYTPVGGEILFVESALNLTMPGSSKLTITGQLGDVMRESVETARAYILAHPEECLIKSSEHLQKNLHLHFPAGAIKKDGPSAGVAIFAALISQFTQKPIASNLAMTGEISLRGDVLPVGGIQEKVLAAHRAQIKYIIIPEQNEKDIEELPADVRSALKFIKVSKLSEVLKHIFVKR